MTELTRRTPWVAIDVDIRKDDRIADLSDDGARWGFVAGVVAEARLQTHRGVFGSRATFEEALGRFARYADEYLETGLVERSPQLCSDCRQRYDGVRPGAIVVHNWHRKQHDPTHAQRQARYRQSGGTGDGAGHADGDGGSDGQRDGDSDAGSDATVTPYSRARAETPDTDTRHQTETETREAPRARPRAKVAGSARSSVLSIEPDDPRHPVAKLLNGRFRWTAITAEQWALLDEVVDNEYPAGTAKGKDPKAGWRWLARQLQALPKDAGSPLDAFLATYNAELDQRRAQAAADEAAWEATKAEYAGDAGPIAAELAASIGPPPPKGNGRAVEHAAAIDLLRQVRGQVTAEAWAAMLERHGVSEGELDAQP